jgi:hypothetical protein
MVNKFVGAAVVILLIAGVYFLWFYQKPPQQQQAVSLSFSIDFPKSIGAGHSATGIVSVTNSGVGLSGVLPVVVSKAISGAVSSPVSLTTGSISTMPVIITGNDVQDGNYSVSVYLQFSSGTGTNVTGNEGTWIYLLPDVEFTSVRYRSEIPFHMLPPYKNTIGANDNTSLLFKVQSMSSSVVYSGLVVSAKLNMTVNGLSVTPSSLPIESIGPQGMTGDYAFAIVSNSAPPGTYGYVISLYSKGNQLIQQIPELIVVTA